MTIDELIATDLAAIAADSRRSPRALDDVLPARRTSAVVPEPLVVVRLATMFAHRVARMAAGATALLCTIALLVSLHGLAPVGQAPPWWAWPLRQAGVATGAAIVVLGLASYLIARSVAWWWFARAMRHAHQAEDPARAPSVVGRQLVGAVEPWSVSLVIAGATCAATTVGLFTAVLASDPLTAFRIDDPDRGAWLAELLRELSWIVAGVIATAVLLGRARARREPPRWLGALERGALPVGVGVTLITAVLWVMLDLRAASWTPGAPPSAHVTMVSVTAAIAMVLVITGLTARRRSREHDDRALARPGAWGEAGPRILALAEVSTRRIGRAAAGALAFASALWLIAVLHNPLAYSLAFHDRGRWLWWLFYERVVVWVIALSVLGARLIGSALAERAFERHLRRALADPAQPPLEVERRLVRRVDGWSIALRIAGATSLATVFAVVRLVFGGGFGGFFQAHGPRVDDVVTLALRCLALAIPPCVAAAVALGRSCAREPVGSTSRTLRVLEHRATLIVGLTLAAIAASAGATLDFGLDDISFPASAQPSRGALAGLIALASLAALLVTTSVTLRRRRRERARASV